MDPISYAKPQLMGILNITPDSFFDGGKYTTVEKALHHVNAMVEAGMDILDMGGESTRPGAKNISEEEEEKRVLPILHEVQKHFPNLCISIDTQKPSLARKCCEKGVAWINDVSSLFHPLMRQVAKDFPSVRFCILHRKKPSLPNSAHSYYPEQAFSYIVKWFESHLEFLSQEGVELSRLILDPGFGFGKTIQDNLNLLLHLSSFKKWGLPVLVGISRKGFMGKLLQKSQADLLPATLVMNTMALLKGADILRVHDITSHRDLIDLYPYLMGKEDKIKKGLSP